MTRLEQRVIQLETENTNLKALVTLSNLVPMFAEQAVDNQRLTQIYNDKLLLQLPHLKSLFCLILW